MRCNTVTIRFDETSWSRGSPSIVRTNSLIHSRSPNQLASIRRGWTFGLRRGVCRRIRSRVERNRKAANYSWGVSIREWFAREDCSGGGNAEQRTSVAGERIATGRWRRWRSASRCDRACSCRGAPHARSHLEQISSATCRNRRRDASSPRRTARGRWTLDRCLVQPVRPRGRTDPHHETVLASPRPDPKKANSQHIDSEEEKSKHHSDRPRSKCALLDKGSHINVRP